MGQVYIHHSGAAEEVVHVEVWVIESRLSYKNPAEKALRKPAVVSSPRPASPHSVRSRYGGIAGSVIGNLRHANKGALS
jgi:hypothetical protein